MIDRLYLVFEIIAVLLCLHGLYGEKFKWNLYTILLIVIEFAVYRIDFFRNMDVLPKVLVGILIYIYSALRFQKSWKCNLLNCVLCVVMASVVQLICYFPVMLCYEALSGIINYAVNVLFLCLIFVLYKSPLLYRISVYMQQEGKIVVAFLLLAAGFIFYMMYQLGVYHRLDLAEYLLLILSIILLLVLLLLLQRQKLQNLQMKAEADLNSLYGDALVELIDKVRIIQHNYESQLGVIQGMIFSAGTLEELKEEHHKYYHAMAQEDGYAKILSGNNDPVIAGLLYSKLCSVDMEKIRITYRIRLNKITDSFLATDVVRILGVLIDNALEEAAKYTHPQLEIKVYEENGLRIEVGNICKRLSNAEITSFFKKGNSTKGEGRGLGLFEVKNTVNKRRGTIIPENVEKDGENWFYIRVYIPS